MRNINGETVLLTNFRVDKVPHDSLFQKTDQGWIRRKQEQRHGITRSFLF